MFKNRKIIHTGFNLKEEYRNYYNKEDVKFKRNRWCGLDSHGSNSNQGASYGYTYGPHFFPNTMMIKWKNKSEGTFTARCLQTSHIFTISYYELRKYYV